MKKCLVIVSIVFVLILTSCVSAVNYTIYFDSNGGSTVTSVVSDGSSQVTIPADPTKDGYIFAGWYWDNNTFEQPFSANSLMDAPLSSNMTVYAKWVDESTPLQIEIMSIYNLAVAAEAFEGTYEEWLETVRGPQGIPGLDAKDIYFQINEGILEWQHEGDLEWIQLINIKTISGLDGKEVLFQVAEGFIQWQYSGDTTWTNLIELATLVGPAGADGLDGTDGTDGREVLFQVAEGYIQWQYVGDTTWTNLIEVASLVGATGEQGVGISVMEINEYGELVVTFTDSTTQNLGQILKVFTVIFKDYNGYVLDVQSIVYNQDAVASSNPTREGYTFTGWNVTFTSVTSNLSVYAQYSIDTYTVIFNSNGGSEVTTLNDIEYGSHITLSIPTKEGYYFGGWFLGNTINDSQYTSNDVITSSITLYARWNDEAFTVTFVDYDNTVLLSQDITYGLSAIAPSNPTREGYTFLSWDNTFIVVTSNLTVTAQYVPINYTIIFDTNGGTSVSDYTAGYETTLPEFDVPMKTGHDFDGWYLDVGCTVPFTDTTMPYQGATLFAKWVLSTYYIVFDTVDGDPIANLAVIYGSDVTSLPEATKTDFIFDGWYIGEVPCELPYTYLLEENLRITAKWIGLADGLNYELVDGEVTITGYIGSATDLTIADTISGYPITNIADDAFMNNATIVHLSFGQYVTIIGNNAFRNMTALETISLPTSATTLGTFVFYDSNNLQMMTISSEMAYELRYLFGNNINYVPAMLSKIKYADGSTTIDRTLLSANLLGITIELADDTTAVAANQFENLQYITEIVIPEGVVSIGSYAFQNSSLTSILIPNTVETIGEYAFSNATLLVTIILPDALTIIENDAFRSSGLVSITIGSNIQQIEYNAFYYCTNLTTVNFESNSQLSVIGSRAFINTAILSITIPASVTIIDFQAFDDCRQLSELLFEENSNLLFIGSFAFNNTNLESVNLPYGVETIDSSAFKDSNLNEIFIPSSVVNIYANIFQYVPTGLIVKTDYVSKPAGWETWSEDTVTVIWGYLETIDNGKFVYASTVSNEAVLLGLSESNVDFDIVIPSAFNMYQVTRIAVGAFENNISIISVFIPNTLQAISAYAFNGATNLETVIFEEMSQIEKIGTKAFYSCSSLINIEIPNSVRTIGNSAFRHASSLSLVLFEENTGLLTIKAYAFAETAIINFVIPNSVILIEEYAFSNISLHACLVIEIYAEISSQPLGWSAFWNANIYQEVEWGVLGSGITDDLYYVIKSDNTIAILRHLFSSNNSDLIIPSTINNLVVNEIASHAFVDNDILVSLEIPDTVTLIGEEAFDSSTLLTTVVFKENSQLETIGNSAFSHCPKLENINLEAAQNLEEISSWAFYNNISLTEIIIPISVSTMGGLVFGMDYNLTIYAEISSLPIEWDEDWNVHDCPVIWGYTDYYQSTITFGTNGGSLIDAITEDEGTVITAPTDPTKDGYTFDDWYSDFELTTPYVFGVMPVDDFTIYAKWMINQYTISFNSNGGSAVSAITQDFATTVTEPTEPTLTEYTFEGWYEDVELTTAYTFSTMPAEDITLYAKWSINQYTITFDSNGGTSVGSITQDYNTSVTEPDDPLKPDDLFAGWYSDEGLTTPYTFTTMPAEDITLYAKWTLDVSDFTFTFKEDSTYEVTGYTGSDTELTIPASHANYPVTSIGEEAFKDNTTLLTIVLGDYVTTIENSAFYGCSNLTHISLPASATTLGTYVFYGCNSLEIMTLSSEMAYELRYLFGNNVNYVPVTLTKIKYANGSAVIDTTMLLANMGPATTLELADDMIVILANQFENTTSIKNIILPEGIITIGNYAFCGSSITSITIPNTVTSIGYAAFQDATSLTSIVMPNNISEIKDYTFSHTHSLTSIVIPDTVTSIGFAAFQYATSLSSIVIPAAVTTIGMYAFWNATLLTTVTFGTNSQLISISSSAFADLPSLTTVTFGTNSELISISSSAFGKATSLTNIVIPDTVTYMGPNVFSQCDSLTIYVKVASLPSGWSEEWNSNRPVILGYIETIDNGEFIYATSTNNTSVILGLSPSNSQTDIVVPSMIGSFEVVGINQRAFKSNIQIISIFIPNTIFEIAEYTFYSATNLTNVTFEEYSQIERIGNYAFSSAASLTSIVIPDTVTNIEAYAFKNCSNLTSIIIPNNVTTIGYETFDNNTSLTIYAEAESQPAGWDSSWNPDSRPVVWGYVSLGQTTISFDTNGGSEVASITKDIGLPVSAPSNPTKTGYTFSGWYSDEELTVTYTFTTMPAEDITLYAKWVSNQYSVEYVDYDGTVLQTADYDYGSDLSGVTAPVDPTRVGYTFDAWSGTVPATMGTTTTTITATYTINQYTISFDSNEGSAVSDIAQDYNSTVTAPSDPSKTGYTFSGWYSDEELTVTYTFTTMPAENIALYADWTINQYTISFNTNGGTSVTAITQDYGTSVTKPTDPTKEGFTFDGWYSDSELTSSYTFTTMSAENITLYAKWGIEESDFIFDLKEDSTYEVTGYTGSDTSIIIAATYSGTAVTSIADYAFEEQTSLTSIVISEGIISIGFGAFWGCTGLTSVILPDSLTTIYGFAFNSCSTLTSIVIPISVTTIIDYAFDYCDALTIYAEASSKPAGWEDDWNINFNSEVPVVWSWVE